MNDIANLAPDLARVIGVNPATLVLLIVIVSKAANIVARRIPDDATGWLGITQGRGDRRWLCIEQGDGRGDRSAGRARGAGDTAD